MTANIGVEIEIECAMNLKSINSDSFLGVAIGEIRMVLTDGGAMLILLFAMLIYTTIYSIAYGREVVECVDIAVVDEDNTPTSRRIVSGLRSGPNTSVSYNSVDMSSAKELYLRRKVHAVVYIPEGLERNLIAGMQANIALMLDGSHLLVYRQVLEQATKDILLQGAEVEFMRLVADDVDAGAALSIASPVSYDGHVLYNPSLGYGSFVMPSVVVVIIQQTLIIGLAMVGVRRRNLGLYPKANSLLITTRNVIAKILVYIVIYSVNLTIILFTIWPLFGFPNAGKPIAVAILMLIYMVAATALGLTLSHLFTRREAPLMLLLWSSVPILLLAGVSSPHEAFPAWLYTIGRIFPSSSAVSAFVMVGTAGASLWDVRSDILQLLLLAVIYTVCAITAEKYCSMRENCHK